MIGGSWDRHRALALLLAWVAAVAGLSVWAPAPAQAADLQLSFTMTSLDVSGYKAKDTVTLEGTVTNTGSVDAYGVQVILWRSRDAIQSLASLRLANSNNIIGQRLPITADHYRVVTTSAEAFVPGQTSQVRLKATLAELGFDTRGAAFAFGADVIARTSPPSEDRASGQLRTFVPIPGKRKVPVTPIVLLTAPPTKLVDNLFRNDSLRDELTGRLSTLLDAAGRPGMSWLIDPALLDEVQDMADGYQVQTADGSRPGTGAEVAEQWLERFADLDRTAGARTLFANPDVNGARLAGDSLIVSRSEQAAEQVSGLDDLPVVAVPAGQVLTEATKSFLAGSGIDAVIARNAARAGALQASTGAPVLAASAAVPGDDTNAQNLRTQYALATTVVAGTKGEVRLLSDDSDLAQDLAATTTWTSQRGLRALLASTPSVRAASYTAVKPDRLSEAEFEALGRLESDFAAYAELAPDSTLPDQSAAGVTRSASSAWVGDSRGFDAQLDEMNRIVGMSEVGESVSLNASARFVMSSRANEFPVTVTNEFTEAIRVKVVVTSNNPQRLTVPPSELVTVEPRQSVTVNIRPEATSNGVVTARAYVATESGRRVTADTPITIEVTDLGVVAWIIVGVSGLVLVGATAWRIRQVRRRLAAGEPARDDA